MLQQVIAASRWGFGEGANRHLVDKPYASGAWSRCQRGRFGLYRFQADQRRIRDDVLSVGDHVMRKPACPTCRDIERGIW